ncbi:hypothetical protein ACIBJF_15325 [Streptomyces sp. NPDC050743]
MRDGETVLLHMVPYDRTTPHARAPWPTARQPEVTVGATGPRYG